MTSTIKVDTIEEKTSANGVAIDSVILKDGAVDVQGVSDGIILDADGDTTISADTDDQINIKVGGTDAFNILGSKLIVADTASHTDDFLQIESPASGGGHGIQIRRNDANSDQQIGTISFGNNTDTDLAQIVVKTDGDSNAGDSGALLFKTQPTSGASTERLRLHSGGVLSASAGIALGVGTANTSSNVLDDYEVGTFTPTLSTTGTNFSSIGYNTQTGEYVKVGDLVIAHVRVTLNALTVGSPSGNVRVSGLPFTSKDTTDMASSIGFVSNINFDISSFGTIDVGAITGANSTTFNLTRTRSNGTADGVPHQAVTSSSTDINGVAIYKTA